VTRQTKNITTFTVFWDDLVRRILGRRLGEYGIKREHEQALMRLGYLTTNDFVSHESASHVEFGSDFWRMLRERYGTNRKAIWMYHNNRDRISRHFACQRPCRVGTHLPRMRGALRLECSTRRHHKRHELILAYVSRAFE
jgi:hypothetical protein